MTINTSSTALLLTSLQQTDQTQSVGSLTAGGQLLGTGSTSATSTTSAASGDSAQISGPGKLFAELQQLSSQDPTKFKSVTSDIASQLQTAAQQTTGKQADFLSNLANKFQTAATTGDASSLQPAHHGHGHHAHGTYNAQGQTVPQTTPSDSTSSTDLSQLFANIANTVSQAVSV